MTVLAGCPRAGCWVPIAHGLALVPVFAWPLIAGLWLGGAVATARLLYLSQWQPDDRAEPISPGGSLSLGLAWPAWVPARYFGITVAVLWRLAVRGALGDLTGRRPGG